MMTRRLLAIGLWLWASPCGATTSVIVSGTNTASNAASTTYHALMGGSGEAWNTTESFMEGYVSAAGTLKSLYVELTTAPDNGAGAQSYTFTIRHNGTTDSDITCAVSEAETTCSDLVNTLAVSAGDRVAIQAVPATTPATSAIRYSLLFDSTTDNESLMLSSTEDSTSTANNRRYALMGLTPAGASATTGLDVMAMAGTLSTFYVRVGTAPGGGVTHTFTVFVNNSASGITCDIVDTATTCSDLSNTAAVVAGDSVDINRADNGAPAATGSIHGLKMVATTAGQFQVMAIGDALPSTTDTEYQNAASGWDTSAWGNEDVKLSLGQSMTVQAMQAKLQAAITSGSYTMSLRDAQGTTTVTCAITSQTCSDSSDSETIANGATLGWEKVPASPSNQRRIGMTFQAIIPAAPSARRVFLISQEELCAGFLPRFVCPSLS